MVELNTGITCACLPVLKSFVSRFFPHLLGTSRQVSAQKQDTETIGAYSRYTPKSLNTLASHKSFNMQNVKLGMRSDISGAEVQVSDSEISRENRKRYGNGVQVTTVFEVEHYPNEDYPVRSVSANTSERGLVLPLNRV
jgi:hypothetical protein